MNKRIKALVNEIDCIRNFYAVDPVQRAAIEDSAELMVKDCVEQIYPQWIKEHKHIEPTNLADAVHRVKEHFGAS